MMNQIRSQKKYLVFDKLKNFLVFSVHFFPTKTMIITVIGYQTIFKFEFKIFFPFRLLQEILTKLSAKKSYQNTLYSSFENMLYPFFHQKH